MNKEESIYFAGLMEDYLNIPSFLCETIEKDLSDGKYKEVIEFIIQRKKEIEEKTHFDIDEKIINKLTFGVNEDTKGEELFRFVRNNMKFNEVMMLYSLLELIINHNNILGNGCFCKVESGKEDE